MRILNMKFPLALIDYNPFGILDILLKINLNSNRTPNNTNKEFNKFGVNE